MSNLRCRLQPIRDFHLGRQVRAIDLLGRSDRPLDRPAEVQAAASADGTRGGQAAERREGGVAPHKPIFVRYLSRPNFLWMASTFVTSCSVCEEATCARGAPLR